MPVHSRKTIRLVDQVTHKLFPSVFSVRQRSALSEVHFQRCKTLGVAVFVS